MVTSAFLLKVIIYVLIAAVIIPAFDLIAVVIRKSRRPCNSPNASGSETAEWTSEHPAPQPKRYAMGSRQRESNANHSRPGPLRRSQPARKRHGVCPPHRVRVEAATSAPRSYVASNGITITPSISSFHGRLVETPSQSSTSAARSGHPHAEYWSYGSPRFYEHL